MGLTPLAAVGGTSDETDRYNCFLKGKLEAWSPLLLTQDVWSNQTVTNVLGQAWPCAVFVDQPLRACSAVLTNEIKYYLAASLVDERKASLDWFWRRRAVIEYLTEESADFLSAFGARALAEIPHPHFAQNFTTPDTGPASHNRDVLDRYAAWYGRKYNRRQKQERTYVRDRSLVTKTYHAPEIMLFGDIHRFSVIHHAQMRPLPEREIILLNDLYSEDDTRFRDRQRTRDACLSFLRFQPWMRPLARAFLLDKVAHGELAPSTLSAMHAQIRRFCLFLEEDGVTSPVQITEQTMERYLAWGNARDTKGKNWYTDVVQLLRAAPVLLPGIWPTIALDTRAARRIKYKQAPDDPRNRLYASREGANRAAPPEAIEKMLAHVEELPSPIPTLFIVGVVTGARAEDLHALLFDCLGPDPHDDRFMILTYWQNKVSRWNRKPLLKTDPAHRAMIERIDEQRRSLCQRYGRETKYLFPVFYGKRESFLDYHWTLNELKGLCLRHQVTDANGKPFDFQWHPLRHHRGTQMAAEGHDILSIMFELGHASPDMASMYVNRRLDLKKTALLQKGGGKFYTIEGRVDTAVTDLLVRKESLAATRVCGGACTLPGQLGEWCEHANACLTCTFFRADGEDVDHFRCERTRLYKTIEDLEEEARAHEEKGQKRMADIVRKRLRRNKDAVQNTDAIIRSIQTDGHYRGGDLRFKPAASMPEPQP